MAVAAKLCKPAKSLSTEGSLECATADFPWREGGQSHSFDEGVSGAVVGGALDFVEHGKSVWREDPTRTSVLTAQLQLVKSLSLKNALLSIVNRHCNNNQQHNNIGSHLQ